MSKERRNIMLARLNRLQRFLLEAKYSREPLGERAHRAGLTVFDVLSLKWLAEKLLPVVEQCRVVGCNQASYCLGLCRGHHGRLKRTGSVGSPVLAEWPLRPKPPVKCKVNGCEQNGKRFGLCWGHVKRKQRGQTVGVPLQPFHAPARHCRRGHEFTPENTYTMPSGRKLCRECRKASARKQSKRAA